jgi:hypothetical protein
MPIKVIHGKQPGPCILVTAAMHGNELNGTEIINRLLNLSSVKKLKGTLIAVPVLNVYGLINKSRYLPGGIELDRCFPGSTIGTHASRLAHLFVAEIFDKADYYIDLQTGHMNYSNFPQVYVNFEDETSKSLAKAFNTPVISSAICEKGMLRTVALNREKPFLIYEAGEAMRFDEQAIKVGLRGIVNVMRELAMLSSKKITTEAKDKSFFAEENIWVRASSSGISYSKYKLGQHIKKGETLGTIKDPFGATEPTIITSPAEAIIVGVNNLPLVHEGEGLFQLAVFSKMEHAASHLEDWNELREDNLHELGSS